MPAKAGAPFGGSGRSNVNLGATEMGSMCYALSSRVGRDYILKGDVFMRVNLQKLAILLILLAAPVLYANSKTSNHELATQVQQRLESVAPNTVVVVVDAATRTAYLQGSVTSQDEVNRITEAIRTLDGVSVIGSNLVVDTATAASLYSAEESDEVAVQTSNDENEAPVMSYDQENQTEAPVAEALTPTDASLKSAVIQALKSEGIMDQAKIRVDTEGGVVTLTGIALSEAQADRMVELAQNVPGVVGVNPNLQLTNEKRPYKVKPNPDVDKEGRPVDDDQNH